MAPPNKLRGYIINANRKRKQQAESAKRPRLDEAAKQPAQESQGDLASDDSSPFRSISENTDDIYPDEMDTSDINNVDMPAVDDTGAATGSSGAGNATRNTRSVGGGMSSSSGGGLRGTAILPRGVRQEGMRVTRKFKKQYLLRLQNDVVEVGHEYIPAVEDAVLTPPQHFNSVNSNLPGSVGIIRYPYHDLPVDMLSFYLSRAEMENMRFYSEARVKHAQVDVYNKTGVLNFETASSVSAIGNNNVGIYLVELSSDIGKKRTGRLPDSSALITEVFWGEHTWNIKSSNSDFSSQNLAQLGARYVRRTLNNKFEYMTPMNATNAQISFNANTFMQQSDTLDFNLPGIVPYFNVNPFIKKRVNASMNEGHFTTWSYKPRDGLVYGYFSVGPNSLFGSRLKFNNRKKMPTQMTPTTSLQTNQMIAPSWGLQNTQGRDTAQEVSQVNGAALVPFAPQPHLATLIDRTTITGELIPPLVIGIEPLVSELPTSTGNTWQPVRCFVDIYVDVELEMELVYGYDYVDPSMPSIPVNYKFPSMAIGQVDTPSNYGPINTEVDLQYGNIVSTERLSRSWFPTFKGKEVPLARTNKDLRAEVDNKPLTRSAAKKKKTDEAQKKIADAEAIANNNRRNIDSIIKTLQKIHPKDQELKNLHA